MTSNDPSTHLLDWYAALRVMRASDGAGTLAFGSVREPDRFCSEGVLACVHRTLEPGQAITLWTYDTDRYRYLWAMASGPAWLELVGDVEATGTVTRSSLAIGSTPMMLPSDQVLTDVAAAHAADTFGGDPGFVQAIRAKNPSTTDTVDVTLALIRP